MSHFKPMSNFARCLSVPTTAAEEADAANLKRTSNGIRAGLGLVAHTFSADVSSTSGAQHHAEDASGHAHAGWRA